MNDGNLEGNGTVKHRTTTIAALALAGITLFAACSDTPGGGPGPDGPVGPQGDLGPQNDLGPQGGGERLAGSGTMVVETREVAGFDRIDLAGEGTVIVTTGEDHSLSIETDDNLFEHLEVSVAGGLLTLATEPGFDIDPTDSITWQVGLPDLTAVTISGAGTIEAPRLTTDRLTAAISGAGVIVLDDLTTTHLNLSVSGAGTITASGTADSVEVGSTGTGTIEAGGLEVATAAVAMPGVGDITLWVTDRLDVDYSGLGSLSVYGAPEITGDADRVTLLGDR
jgi:hypothetical protein